MRIRYVFGILLLSLLTPSLCSAQDFEAAIGGGYSLNSAVTIDHVYGNRGGFSGSLSGGAFIEDYLSLGVLYEQNRWGYSTATGNIDLASPARSFSGYICKHYQLPNLHPQPRYSEFCIKAIAGYTLITKGSPYVQHQASQGFKDTYRGGGLNIGLQLQFLHPISKFVSGFINVGTGRAFVSGHNTRDYKNYPVSYREKISYNIQYYTSEIGIIYRIFQ